MSELVGKCFHFFDYETCDESWYLVTHVNEDGQAASYMKVSSDNYGLKSTSMGECETRFFTNPIATDEIPRAEFDKAYKEAKARIEELLK